MPRWLCQAGVSCFLGSFMGLVLVSSQPGTQGLSPRTLGRLVLSQLCRLCPHSLEHTLSLVTNQAVPLQPGTHGQACPLMPCTQTGLSPQDLASKVHLCMRNEASLTQCNCLCFCTPRNWPQGPNHPSQTGLASTGSPQDSSAPMDAGRTEAAIPLPRVTASYPLSWDQRCCSSSSKFP